MKNKPLHNLQSAITQSNRSRNNTIFIILVLAILFFVSLAWPFMFSFRLGILTQQSRFDKGEFERISVSGITDNQGTLTFIDTDLNVVYPEDLNFTITQSELDNMVDVEMVSQEILSFTYEENDMIYRQIYSKGDNPRTSWFLVVDEDNNYVRSENFYYVKQTYTEDDINYVIYDYIREARDYRYYFETIEGDEYYMIINLDSRIALYEPYEVVILVSVVGLIIFLAVILIKRPTKKLSDKLNQPIIDLSKAMEQFVPGESVYIDKKYNVIEYDSIVDTFNKMVTHINNLEQSNKDLVKSKKDMFAAIAHDLKSPITVLNGYINAILTNKIKEEDIGDYYDKILVKSEQLTKLINEFALYNEIEHSNFKLDLISIDLNNYLRDYLADNYQYINDSGYNLLIDIKEDKLNINLDKFRFTRALDNLISNFIKYNPINTKIHVQVEDLGETIEIVLENNGTPISEEISNTLFNPFVIDDKSRNTESTGLGLSITRRIVELHNGSIKYESNEEYCNSFKITLKKQ